MEAAIQEQCYFSHNTTLHLIRKNTYRETYFSHNTQIERVHRTTENGGLQPIYREINSSHNTQVDWPTHTGDYRIEWENTLADWEKVF